MIKIRIMMKKIFTLTAAVVSLLFVSCEKQAIGYLSDDIDVTKFAQIRFVNDLPIVPSGTTYNVTRLKYNDALVSEVSTTLGSILPNSAAKYHVVPIGPLKIDAYRSATKDVAQVVTPINLDFSVPLCLGIVASISSRAANLSSSVMACLYLFSA